MNTVKHLSKFILLTWLTTLGACQSPAKSWVHDDLYSKIRSGTVKPDRVTVQFKIDNGNCVARANQIATPGPNCIQGAPSACAGLTGFAQGICLSQNESRCDHSAQNAARHSQREVFNGCMYEKGWRLQEQRVQTLTGSEKTVMKPRQQRPLSYSSSDTREKKIIDDQKMKIEAMTRELERWEAEQESKQ